LLVDCTATRLVWVRLPNLPVPLYDARMAADKTAAYVAGGHLCARPDQTYPFYYTNQVRRVWSGREGRIWPCSGCSEC
jgi:hypothetical protein